MSTATPALLDADAARRLATRCFVGSDADGDRIGLELEWHVHDPAHPTRRLTLEEVTAAVGAEVPLAPEVTVSIEPGGQVEIDTLPLSLVAAGAAALAAAAELHVRLGRAGLTASSAGADPHRRPENLLDVPRYVAMAEAFSVRGPQGIQMMANTAAMQVNIDLDPDGDRWRLAHQLGPVLVAAFANSPIGPDRSIGWKSHRLATWWHIDPTRTAPVDHTGDPGEAWLRYALAANVLLIRRGEDAAPILEPFPFEQWLRDGHPLGRPTVDDFAYHLTTLFPPVRPRGYLELRFLDALDHPQWLVAAALIAGLTHEHCRGTALAVTEPATGRWMDAARDGLGSVDLADVADAATDLALTGLDHLDVDDAVTGLVRAWRDEALTARRCPADDLLDRWDRTGAIVTVSEPAAP